MLGFRHVDPKRAAQVIDQEARAAGFTQATLDMNPYVPRPGVGLADLKGAAANSSAVMDNMAQTSGKFGTMTVSVLEDGRVVTSKANWSDQGREALVSARRMMSRPGQGNLLHEFEGHQGAPIRVGQEDWGPALAAQLRGIRHAEHAGQLVQMAKYANRAASYGMPFADELARVLKQVAGQKDPADARAILQAAGIGSVEDLMKALAGH